MSRRRVRLLAMLSQGLGEVQRIDEVVAFGLGVLAREPDDIVAAEIAVRGDAEPDDGRLRVQETPAGPVARTTLGAAAPDAGDLVFVAHLNPRQPLGERLVEFVRVVASALRQAIRVCGCATVEAQVGGDWYDSFLRPDGALMLVIGDAAGHDRQDVAAMGQLRNLLRGVAHTLEGPPAAVLAKLDEAMQTLGLDVFATG